MEPLADRLQKQDRRIEKIVLLNTTAFPQRPKESFFAACPSWQFLGSGLNGFAGPALDGYKQKSAQSRQRLSPALRE